MVTTVAKLLAQKRDLLERLERYPGPRERADIEQLQQKIDIALNFLDDASPAAEFSGSSRTRNMRKPTMLR
jgi:lysyl-tRNA synthetase class I